MSEHWVLGWYLKALYASKNFSENYTATMWQAGEFSPTLHSKMTYNEAFRANQFVGVGIRPVYRLNKCSIFEENSMDLCRFIRLRKLTK